MDSRQSRPLAFSIDFEPFCEAMQESIDIPENFPRFDVESELSHNAEACLELLFRHGVSATFFMLGWIAEKFPRIVRLISEAGHEVASHSFYHRRLTGLSQQEAEEGMRRSKETIEDLLGEPVYGFRAPDFSLPCEGWMCDYLAELGYLYDSSSVATAIRDDYGKGWTRAEVHRLPNGLLEFPIPTKTLPGGVSLPVGGGGYFRLFPFVLTRRWLAACPDRATYLHPYEIGGDYPQDIDMSFLRRLRHTRGNGRLDTKLAGLFDSFDAMPVLEYLRRFHGLDRNA